MCISSGLYFETISVPLLTTNKTLDISVTSFIYMAIFPLPKFLQENVNSNLQLEEDQNQASSANIMAWSSTVLVGSKRP